MKPTNPSPPEFHVMDYVRKVRAERNELYLQDKSKYLEHLNSAMADFLRRQSNVHSLQRPVC
jgi:hypothetical protein